MSRIKYILSNLGFDGWTFLLCGLAAIVIAVLDFIQVVELTTPQALRMVLVATGLVLGSIAVESGRRTAELREISEAVGATSVEIVESNAHVQQSIAHARRFILDTTLHLPRARIAHPADDHSYYAYTIFERVRKGEVTYRKVESIPSKERLEYVISRLLIFEGMDYLVRYYDSPSKPIPVLNMMSIDNEGFYLGSFYNSDAPSETVNSVFLRSSKLSRLFEAYWNNLWNSAKPLNEGKRIDWDELRAISHRVGMSEDEFDQTVNRWKDEIQRRKRRSH
jgi:hypothetical protein